MEVLPGIHQLKGFLWSNVFLLEDGDKLALVDAGLHPRLHKLLDYIRSMGRDPAELDTIILTHGHPDHTFGLRPLQRSTNIKVLVHSGDVKSESGGRSWIHYPSQPVAREWDVPFLQKLYFDEVLHDGQVLPIMDGLEVLHTPGHTPGSVVLYLRSRGILFTGDSLLSNGKVFRRPIPFPGTDFKDYRRSIERISRLDFEVALPGHGQPMMSGGQAMVKEMLHNYFWAFAWGRLLGKLSPRSWTRRRRSPVH